MYAMLFYAHVQLVHTSHYSILYLGPTENGIYARGSLLLVFSAVNLRGSNF